MSLSTIDLSVPLSTDGHAVHQLIASCPPLDQNSMYCNLLQATHFASTSVSAKRGGELVGFISGYALPERPDTLFIWQVAVDESARGCGLALSMLQHILQRPHCSEIHALETSITASNQASWALFRRLASNLNAQVEESILFDHVDHFRGIHDTEALVHIGPF
ncbi:MAG: L-2,4-diaminobutyric acid acetyltransferase [Motiliproteus sp.]